MEKKEKREKRVGGGGGEKFPGGPVVRAQPPGSVPAWGAKILLAMWPGQKISKIKKTNKKESCFFKVLIK